MAVYKRGDTYWYEFIFAGKRVRESAKTASKTVAKEAERNHRRALERTLAGLPSEFREDRIRSVSDVIKAYLHGYELNHRPSSLVFARKRLAHVNRLLGTVLLPDLKEAVILDFIRTRVKESAAGRTINMELGELSRAIGHPWSILWPKVRKMEERKDVGKALSVEEEARLLDALSSNSSPNASPLISTFVRIALATGMRSGEITSLTWEQVTLTKRVITVGRAKTSSGTGRQIPINRELFEILRAHAEWFTMRFGETRPEHFLFPFGTPKPADPTKPVTDLTSAWDALRKKANVRCRLHDLRHTAATKMAEAGVPESTMLSLMGHMSRAMLERYSHIRMAAKRDAVEALTTVRGQANSQAIPTKSPTSDGSEAIHYA